MKNLTIYGLFEDIAYCEAKGLSNVFGAYADQCSRESIQDIGFNQNSGYVYIALENGIQIASCMGRDAEYIVYNFENGEETFFSTYEEAEEFSQTLNA
jgi:hypothetical protein